MRTESETTIGTKCGCLSVQCYSVTGAATTWSSPLLRLWSRSLAWESCPDAFLAQPTDRECQRLTVSPTPRHLFVLSFSPYLSVSPCVTCTVRAVCERARDGLFRQHCYLHALSLFRHRQK